MQVFSLRGDKRKIPSYTRSLSQLLDTSDIRTLGRYILELKQRRENKLQNVNINFSNIHHHVTIEIFWGQGGQ